jgi:hypothetical protein
MSSKLYALIACAVLCFVLCWIGYNEINTSNMTVAVQLKQGEDPFVTLKTILPPDTAVVEVREMDRQKNEYKMTVKTRQRRVQFLEWLRSNSRVEKVEERP